MSTGRRRGRKHQRSQQQNLDNVPPHKRLKLTLPDLDKPSHVHHRQDVIGESDDDEENDLQSADDAASPAIDSTDNEQENSNSNNHNSNHLQPHQPVPYEPQMAKLKPQQKIAENKFKVIEKPKAARSKGDWIKCKLRIPMHTNTEIVMQSFVKLLAAANMPDDLDLYNLKFANFPTKTYLPDLVLGWNLDRPDIDWDPRFLTFYLTQIHSAKKTKKHRQHRSNTNQIITDKQDLNEAFKEAECDLEKAFGAESKCEAVFKSQWQRIKENGAIYLYSR